MASIAVLGDFTPESDEGYKNVAHNIASRLELRGHSMVRLNVKDIRWRLWTSALLSRPPEVIHAITQPTRGSLAILRAIKARWPDVTTVVSALKPDRFLRAPGKQGLNGMLTRWLRPDLVLVQSETAMHVFSELCPRVEYLGNGVDIERFRPSPQTDRTRLRQQHGLDPHRPLVLHVGHLHRDRNLTALSELPKLGIQVLVAGSTYLGANQPLLNALTDSGIRVLVGFQPRIEELYRLADCYAFPVAPGNSLATPLSILEAMATDLPVVTTPFEGITHAFRQVEGVRIVSDSADFAGAVGGLLAEVTAPATRSAVMPHSWPRVIDQLEQHYAAAS